MRSRFVALVAMSAIVLVVAAAGIAASWRDPPLDAKVMALVAAARSETVHAHQNALLPILGIDAPDHTAPANAGAAELHRLIEASLTQTVVERPRKVFGDLADLCDPRAARCYAVATTHPNPERIDALAAKYDLALARYHALRWFDRYDETAVALALRWSVHLASLREVQRLVLSKAFVDGARRADHALIAAIDADAHVWRSILAGSATRVTKVSAAMAVATNAAAISELIEKVPGFARQHADRIARALAPLTASERSIANHITTELRHDLVRYLSGVVHDDRIPAWRRRAPFFLMNATINERFETYEREELRIAALAPADLLQARAQPWPRRAEALGWLFNPTGREMLDLERQDWSAFALRIHDVDALLRLVGAQLDLRARAVPLDAVEAHLAALASARDPYTGAPIAWNRAERVLSVTANAQDRPARGRFEVRIDESSD